MKNMPPAQRRLFDFSPTAAMASPFPFSSRLARISSAAGRRPADYHDRPGTGIAPFQRFRGTPSNGATGKLVFFGDQKGAFDFLYRRN
jgi:hypothetical protein